MSGNKYIRQYIDLNLYQYNVKKQKKGYAKLEARNEQCKINIYVNDVLANEDEEFTAYIFKYDKGKMKGILLGKLDIMNNIGQLKLSTSRSNIMGYDVNIDELSGIAIVKRNIYSAEIKTDASYGGTWKESIQLHMQQLEEYSNINDEIRVEEEKEEEISEKEEKLISEKDVKEYVKEDIKEDITIEAAHLEIDNELNKVARDVELEEKEIEETEIIEKNYIDEPIVNIDKEIINTETEEIINTEDIRLDKQAIKNANTIKLKPNDDGMPDTIIQNLYNNREKYDINLRPNEDKTIDKMDFTESTQENPLKEIQAFMFNKYPKMEPFENSLNVYDCIRIEPKDIAALPINIWMLMNNTFLLTVYNKYKHLILFEEEDNLLKQGYHYNLGVPGIYHKKDKFIAYLYGFSKFKCCANTYPKSGEYGYWTIDIPLD